MEEQSSKHVCGIVMPISTIDGCTSEHWAEVQKIFIKSIEDAGFNGRIVSDADDVGVIHKRIIQNLRNNPIVICDVSAKNPNVMFELGMRLAFDMPAIIVKDDKTDYVFDFSFIEHITYPRDLNYSKINEFKNKLSRKIKSTYLSAQSENYTTFLKHFDDTNTLNIARTARDLAVSDRLERVEKELSFRRDGVRLIPIIGEVASGIWKRKFTVIFKPGVTKEIVENHFEKIKEINEGNIYCDTTPGDMISSRFDIKDIYIQSVKNYIDKDMDDIILAYT
jgi:hypothetical protein